ncbi:MAG: MlaE family lipid ABC transporter permease subunit [Gammaproteobacteria bacterium]|nr:MlaE family lipid ABC transporter permease subunit [Gammaproteobacteria bacterium]
MKKIHKMKKNSLADNQLLVPTKQGFLCRGGWSILHLASFTPLIKHFAFPQKKSLVIDGSQLAEFDSSGALALTHCIEKLKAQGNTITLEGFNQEQHALLDLITKQKENLSLAPAQTSHDDPLTFIGKETVAKLIQTDDFIILLGDLTTQFFQAFTHWKRFQLPSVISVVHSAGLNALPILGLLSFLIGVVLAYQMGLQLQTYGANIFIAYLSGMAIFREFGPLITAIIIAGRTSSSFTAQIGSMIVNEEVDAIQAMGLSPVELLVMPKVLGLLIIFPILIFWSDLFGILGAMLMSKTSLSVGYGDFLSHLQDSVGTKQFYIGLYKAPAFAMIIAMVGCFQGFRVLNRTDSIGVQTTKSVVQALFLIIVADAIYSVIYSWMDL